MPNSAMRLVRVLCLSALVLCLVQKAPAAEGRQFAAKYQLNNIVEDGNEVELTISLNLMNNSSAAVKGGVVVILNTLPEHAYLGDFSAIKSLPEHGQAPISQTLTISAAEYARWQQGKGPIFEFLVPGPGGTTTEGVQAERVLMPTAETK